VTASLGLDGADLVIEELAIPGTGKTILAQQYLFANATLARPALYLATVSEPFDKILRYGQSLRFFDPEAVGQSVFYEDLGLALNERGLAGVLEQVTALIKERRPGILVIDSFKALSAYAEAAEFRRFIHDLPARSTSTSRSGSEAEPRIVLNSKPSNRERSSSAPCCSEYRRALDAIARLVLCVLELLLALADLLLGFALLLAEFVVGQLALGLLELALDLVTHTFHGDPFRLVFEHEWFPPLTSRNPVTEPEERMSGRGLITEP
jgi:hypothetical protein